MCECVLSERNRRYVLLITTDYNQFVLLIQLEVTIEEIIFVTITIVNSKEIVLHRLMPD